MATKKASTKKATMKKATSKPVAKKAITKPVAKSVQQPVNMYNTNVSVLLAMAVEALILLLGYLIIMNAA